MSGDANRDLAGPDGRSSGSRCADIAEWVVLAALLAIFAWRGFLPGWRTLNSDFPTYYLAASLHHRGIPLSRVYKWTWFQRQKDYLDIPQSLIVFVPNPPLVALPVLPLSLVSHLAAKRVWLVLNLAFLLLALGDAASRDKACVAPVCAYFPAVHHAPPYEFPSRPILRSHFVADLRGVLLLMFEPPIHFGAPGRVTLSAVKHSTVRRIHDTIPLHFRPLGGPSEIQFLGQNNNCAQVAYFNVGEHCSTPHFRQNGKNRTVIRGAGTAHDHSCHNVAATEFIFLSSCVEQFLACCPRNWCTCGTILALFDIVQRSGLMKWWAARFRHQGSFLSQALNTDGGSGRDSRQNSPRQPRFRYFHPIWR
jgi:hypothetical protein